MSLKIKLFCTSIFMTTLAAYGGDDNTVGLYEIDGHKDVLVPTGYFSEKDRTQVKPYDHLTRIVFENRRPTPPAPEIEMETEEASEELGPELENAKAKAREKAKKLLEGIDALSDLRDMMPITPRKLSATAGKEAKIDRSIITSRVHSRQ